MESVKDNLIFSLDSWPETGISCDFVLSPSLILPHLVPPDDEMVEVPNLVTSVRGHLELQLMGRRLQIKGGFAVKTEMTCARCLSTFIGKVGDSIDEVVQLDSPDSPDLAGDQESYVPLKNRHFDLIPLLCEFFWLSWPVRAVCRPDCKGLCPGCGANLNDGPCLCHESTVTRH